MKSYRNVIATLALVSVFSMSAFASEGIIHTEKTPPPPPQAEGIIHTEKILPPPPQAEAILWTDIALDLMQTLLPVL